MSLILNIDTSIETASVSIAEDGKILAHLINDVQKEHASFLHVAIQKLLAQIGVQPLQLDAIAVTEGPGSYTGLRVGMASAKGLAYALSKPFITINTLMAIAQTAINTTAYTDTLYAPMIDARRMEVFTAVYDAGMEEILAPCAMILNDFSFDNLLADHKILFAGNGMPKWKNMTTNKNALFADVDKIELAINVLSYKKYLAQDFTSLASSEPLYIKPFYNGN